MRSESNLKTQKIIIIINGQPTVGKDYLCKVGNQTYPSMVVSSVDRVKEAFKILGDWDGVTKTEAERTAMSYMKKISVEYNDGPTRYMISKIKEFVESDLNILYFMIREPEEIEHALEEFRKVTNIPVVTLIIRREDLESEIDIKNINDSDRNVLDYKYDYIFYNKINDPLIASRYIDYLTHIMNIERHSGLYITSNEIK